MLNPNQSGFMPGDSCVHQLISITNETCTAFGANPLSKVRAVFLDISKTFGVLFTSEILKELILFGMDYDVALRFKLLKPKSNITVKLLGDT